MHDFCADLPSDLSLTRASLEDVPHIKAIVTAAYSKYIERIGKPPAPMTANYNQLLESHDIFVLRTHNEQATNKIVGSIVLGVAPDDDSVKINNLVVDPEAQGKGYGRILMNFAQYFAKQEGRAALTLFTNIKMYENLTLYEKMGFEVTGKRTEDGFERVYFRRLLP